MDKIVIAAAGGCILALALWKAAKEQAFPAFIGLAVIAISLRLADGTEFPFDALILGCGGAIFGVGKWLWIDKDWKKSGTPGNLPT